MKNVIFTSLFAILYLSTALVSTIHAVNFFGLGNPYWLAMTLALTFEVGQAAVLMSLLMSSDSRKRVMPWILMIVLTSVQVLGNVFSSYKYLMDHSSDLIRYFTEPVLFFMDPADSMVNVTLTYIIGAILPVVALCLTSLVVDHIHAIKDEGKPETPVELPQNPEPELLKETILE